MRVIISLFVLSSLSILRASPVNLSHKTPSAAIPIRVDVIITSSDSFLLGVAPFVNLMRLLPGKVSVEVSLAMQKDSTGEYKCFGLNCTELKLPLRTNLTLLKGLVLQKKSQKKFMDFVQCFQFDKRDGLGCGELFNVNFDEKTYASVFNQSKKDFPRFAEKSLDLSPDDKFPVVYINSKKYRLDTQYNSLLVYLNDLLPKNKKLPGFDLTMNDPSWPDLVGIVVEAPGLKFKRDYEWEEGLLQRFPKLKFNALSPDSPEAIAIIKKYEVKSLPMYMLKVAANIEVYPELKGLLAGYLRDKKDDALIHSSINSRYLIESEVHPGSLALFTRPLGLDAMPDSRRYFEKISQSPPAGLKEIRLNYLVTKDEKGNFTASDGETEIEEVSRQLLIQKYFPEKFFSYALTLSANRQYKDWELILKKMEIDPKFFEKKRGEGKLLLEKNWEEAQLLSIKTVNTLVWENKRILGSGSKAWKRLAELNKTK